MTIHKETRALWSFSSSSRGLLPILRRHGLHNHADELLACREKFMSIARCLRDVELLEKDGCCCGQKFETRTSKPLCEGCLESRRAVGVAFVAGVGERRLA